MTMIEQMARALAADFWETAPDEWKERNGSKEEYLFQFGRGWIGAARAALDAFEPNDGALRAFYEAQCPPGEMPIGGFSRWATWEEARASRAPEIKKCLRAMIAAVLTENPE